jgi:hypothetical protein
MSVPGTALPDPAVTRTLAVLGLVGAGLAVVLVGMLHVVAADQVNPVRRTISEYALGESDWMFDAGVLGLSVGSALVLLALVRAGILRPWSGAAVLLAVWAVALVIVVAFDKANWSVGPSMSGYVHRYASLAAFASLPVAALALGRRWRGDTLWGSFAAWSRWAGVLALLAVARLDPAGCRRAPADRRAVVAAPTARTGGTRVGDHGGRRSRGARTVGCARGRGAPAG